MTRPLHAAPAAGPRTAALTEAAPAADASRRSWLAAVVATVSVAVLPGAVLARGDGPNREQPVRMVVLHSTGGPTCDRASGRPIWVGAGELRENIRTIEAHPTLGIHYMIDRDGTLVRSVPESQVAHHVFRFSGESIAIELVNDGDGRDPFPPAQVNAAVDLLRDIARRHGLARGAMVRHSDVDRGTMTCDRSRRRKVDPGDAWPHEAVLDRVFGPAAGR